MTQLFEIPREQILAVISRKIPTELLVNLPTPESNDLYQSILYKLIDESLPEGSTILQILVVERCAYYFVRMHEMELKGKEFTVNADYRFFVQQYNSNLEILRQLALRSLPAQQVKVLAKKTIKILERVLNNPSEKETVIKELVSEFTVMMPATVFKTNVAIGADVG